MIYLLEDDDSIRKLVVYALQSQGFEAMGFDAPEKCWDAMSKQEPRLVLLDIMLPGEDGISILRRLRAKGPNPPVIMLTAKNTEYDRVEGLDAGADDYISKPFGIMEMVARVRAVLRRTEQKAGFTEYSVGDLFVCPERHEVKVAGEEVTLTYKEYELLLLFLRNRGIALYRETIYQRVWGGEMDPDTRTLDLHVQRLRKKLGWQKQLVSIYKVGYRLEE